MHEHYMHEIFIACSIDKLVQEVDSYDLGLGMIFCKPYDTHSLFNL